MFERSSTYQARKPFLRKNSKKNGASARSGLEPELCGHKIAQQDEPNLHMRSNEEPGHRDNEHTLHYGESADPAKMTSSRMALIKGGPSFLKLSASTHDERF